MEKTDVLVGKGVEIEIEPYNERFGPGIKPFLVSVKFRTSETGRYVFDPSRSFLTLPSDEKVYAKGARNVSFHYSPPQSYFKAEEIIGPVIIENGIGSAALFFDIAAPSVNKVFSLTIEGLDRDGIPINIPPLRFSRGER